jgi:hypothetical protein
MKKLALLIAVATLPLFCQQTKVQPDCTLGAVFTTTGNSSVFDNRAVQSVNSGPPCTLWALTWYAQSAVTSLTINIEGAPDVAGVAGSFASLAAGSTFPNGKLTFETSTQYSPWMRITVSAAGGAGLIYAVLNGWREDQASIGGGSSGSGCPGTTATPCVVIGPTAQGSAPTKAPVQIAEVDNAGNIITPTFCNTQIPINLSSVTGENQVIALSGSTVIRLCNLAVGMSAASTVAITAGTGSNCGTSTVTLWGPYPSNTTGFAEDWSGVLMAPAGDAICLNFGGTVTAGGGISYAQY